MLGTPIKSTPIRAEQPVSPDTVDGASLAVLRITIGVAGLVSMARLWLYGWLDSLYVAERHLRYPLLGWIPTPGTTGIRLLVLAIALSALALTVGWHARGAAGCFALLFGWFEFIDVSTYLNHYWFITLMALLLAAAPCDTVLAVRARSVSVTSGWVWLARCQVGFVYGFAAIAKINTEWLIHGRPLRLWLPARSDIPFVGGLLELPFTAVALSWAGLVFDLSIVPLLCCRRTRYLAWGTVIAFHVATWVLFPIGLFPWVMIASTTVFFAPDWPRRWLRGRQSHVSAHPARRPVPWAVAAWLAVMIALPCRAVLIPGDARWTMEGYRFAWNVLLTERGGDLQFRIVDIATDTTTRTTAETLYTPLQWKVMSTEPELIRQAAHALAGQAAADGRTVAVFVDAFVSLNGRRAVRIIDPDVDLSKEPYRPFGQPWILPSPG